MSKPVVEVVEQLVQVVALVPASLLWNEFEVAVPEGLRESAEHARDAQVELVVRVTTRSVKNH